ncbi:MAG: sensor histidine kinase [Deltaproteobacteria bacterium]|jgi:signal transduction histidine kinase|nr:sensor histidine kinase [Deltaproteobacteria bacterium]
MHAKSTELEKQRRQAVANMLPMAEEDYTPGGEPCGRHIECLKAKVAWCTSQRELQLVSARLLEIQESERRRIATDLHDVLGQSLTMIKISLDESLQLLAGNETEVAAESLRRLIPRVKDALGEVRRVAMDLRPSILDDLGILATLSWFFREFGTVCQDMEVEKDFSIEEKNVPVPLKITIFRIIQEATSNIVKHANASRIRVSLKNAGGALHLSIEDDGVGFDAAETANYCPLDKSLGLLSMKERAKLSGGQYELVSAVGQGTRISVLWPLGMASDG